MYSLGQTKYLFFFRKPAGIPTVRGKEPCFLDTIKAGSLDTGENIADFPHFTEAFGEIQTMIGASGGDVYAARTFLLETFSAGEEYGLVNRLDTATSGMLYFARSRDIYNQRREWQHQGNIEKYYLAHVHSDIARQHIDADDPYCTKQGTTDVVFRFPLMHHRFDATRMVSCRTPAGLTKLQRQGTGAILDAETAVHVLNYDTTTDTSIVRVCIRHGRRHQIRVHFATLGYPIIGDELYGTSSGVLQLVSAGCRVVAENKKFDK